MLSVLLAILISFAAQFIIYYGLGTIVSRAIGERDLSVFPIVLHGLFGLVFLTTILHLFRPVDVYGAVPIALLAVIGFVFYGYRSHSFFRIPFPVIALSITLLLAVSYLPESRLIHADTGLYHAQKVLWLNEEPVWPGLAHLHTRFGFNVSFFYAVAFFRQILPFPEFLHYSICSFWLIGFALYMLCLSARQPEPIHTFLLSLCIPLTIYPFLVPGLWGFSPDPIVTVITLFLLIQILISIRTDQIVNPVSLMLWTGLIISIKLSSAPMLLPFLALISIRHWYEKLPQRKLVAGFMILSVFFLLWGFHGYVESGYISYPAPLSFGHAPWGLSEQQRSMEADIIRAWARSNTMTPEQALTGFGWIQPWFLSQRNLLVWLTLLGSLIVGAGVIISRPGLFQKEIWLYGLAWLSVFTWFYLAPDRRFGMPILLFSVSLPVYFLAKRWPEFTERLPVQAIALGFIIVILTGLSGYKLRSYPLQAMALPVPETELTVEQPLRGREPIDGGQCWLVERPCSPSITKTLREVQYSIGPFNLRGFSIAEQN